MAEVDCNSTLEVRALGARSKDMFSPRRARRLSGACRRIVGDRDEMLTPGKPGMVTPRIVATPMSAAKRMQSIMGTPRFSPSAARNLDFTDDAAAGELDAQQQPQPQPQQQQPQRPKLSRARRVSVRDSLGDLPGSDDGLNASVHSTASTEDGPPAKRPRPSTSSSHATHASAADSVAGSTVAPRPSLLRRRSGAALDAAARRLSRRSVGGCTSPPRAPDMPLSDHDMCVDDFEISRALGRGKYGNVYLARVRATRQVVALKVLFKSSLRQDGAVPQLRREVEIQARLKHPHVVRLLGYFDDETKVYLVLEYAEGGNLYKVLQERTRLPEPEAAQYVLAVASALQYCHQRNVYHRDLKPENVLLLDDGRPAVGDFGWAVHAPAPHHRRDTVCGTPEYVAPELVLGQPYTRAVDLWALGVLAYELLIGHTPFCHANRHTMYGRIAQEPVSFPVDALGTVSREARALIRGLLQKDPEMRLTCEDVVAHPWIRSHCGQLGPERLEAVALAPAARLSFAADVPPCPVAPAAPAAPVAPVAPVAPPQEDTAASRAVSRARRRSVLAPSTSGSRLRDGPLRCAAQRVEAEQQPAAPVPVAATTASATAAAASAAPTEPAAAGTDDAWRKYLL